MLNKQSFETDQEIRWCPGCGDYAILSTMQKFLPELGIMPHNTVFISGIGCSSRFPYYMNTYGFHTIHGRAPTIATGLSITRPELSIWVVTGDGDGLSIGANHLLHLMRRNINVKVLLFNNRIYGLTKGQYSPTSDKGTRSKSTPDGSVESPLNPLALALAAGCGFVARAIDVDSKGLHAVLKAASQHSGTAFIEVLQNCHVFNDGVFSAFSERAMRLIRTWALEPGRALHFGENKGIRWDLKGQAHIVSAAEADLPWLADDPFLARQMAELWWPDYPVPVGIFYAKERPLYQEAYQALKTKTSLETLLKGEHTWVL